ncbi:hypothetical protein CSA17_05780 [bacterium DOLJORAL78_65_58]|nr:MAG: hypothetical protein CSB20_03695 [bacterium DOLZORAL124_64_63]PIE75763.1 MAG: hypothetical protein CSA17_05780 [bacterium DOLJORAL78_65_58]
MFVMRMIAMRMFAMTRTVLFACVLLLSGPAAVWAQVAAGPLSADLAAAPVITLRECVDLALESSPSLLIAHERQGIAGQEVTAAYGNFLPTVSLSRDWAKSERTDFDNAAYTHGMYPMVDSGGDTLWFAGSVPTGTYVDETVRSASSSWSGAADLNLFQGFGKFSRLNAAKSKLRAAEATLGYTRELVVEEVTTAYFNVLRYEKLLEVAVETRDQAMGELERIETYFRLGSSAKSDVLQQRVRVENTKLDVVVARNNVQKARADLAYSMNRPLAESFQVDGAALQTDYAVEPVDSLYAEALSQRLDLHSSAFTLEASRSDVTTASAGLYPSLSIFGRYSRNDNESPYKFGSQVSESILWGYSVNWNIFDRLQSWTGRKQAKANVRIAEYQLEQARLNVQVEIRQLHGSLTEAALRAAVSHETIVQSQEELRLARERYRVGAGTTLDIISAQVNLANSRAMEVQAMCDFLIARAKLDRAVGREYPDHE